MWLWFTTFIHPSYSEEYCKQWTTKYNFEFWFEKLKIFVNLLMIKWLWCHLWTLCWSHQQKVTLICISKVAVIVWLHLTKHYPFPKVPCLKITDFLMHYHRHSIQTHSFFAFRKLSTPLLYNVPLVLRHWLFELLPWNVFTENGIRIWHCQIEPWSCLVQILPKQCSPHLRD